jgi:hypothetical protein
MYTKLTPESLLERKHALTRQCEDSLWRGGHASAGEPLREIAGRSGGHGESRRCAWHSSIRTVGRELCSLAIR